MESLKHLIVISGYIVSVMVLVSISTVVFFGILKSLMFKAFKGSENQMVFGIILAAVIIAFAVIASVAILPQY